MSTDRPPPVFIVGFPRSGTTLLAALLGAHSRMSCGPETEFFTGLGPAHRGNRLCRAATWPEEAADYLGSLVHEKPIPDYYGISRGEILAFLRRRERSLAAILESLTETYMSRQGKHRWVEKTPTHLIHARAIRRCYPDAPIIRILRDPRDVALSMLKVPWGPSHYPAAILLWQLFDERSARFFATDRRTWTVRFEDLLHDPEAEVRTLCRFIGEEFEPGMMDTSRSIGHVNPTRIAWKQNAGGELDPGRTGVWRRETTAEQQAQAEAIVGDRLRAYGYPASRVFGRYLQVINLGVLTDFPALVDHLLDGDTRFWRVRAGEAPRLTIFVGDPCRRGWLGGRRTQRLGRVLQVGACAAAARARRTPLFWLGAPAEDERPNWGLLGRTLASLLPQPLAIDAFCTGPHPPLGRRT